MITRTPPRTRQLLVLGLVLSVVLHLFGGALWPYGTRLLAYVMQRQPDQHPLEQTETSDVIRLEKRTVARQSVQHRVQPPQPQQPPLPRPVAAAPPPEIPRPAEQPHAAPAPKRELSHVTIHVARQYSSPKGGSSTAEVAYRKPAAEPKTTHAPAQLTPEQIAQLTSQFSRTIADTRTDLATVQEETQREPATMKHYAMNFVGTHDDLRRGQGYISPISRPQRIGNLVYYYTHYIYMHLDGTIEEDDIPWPYAFPVNHDLFALHIREIPMQPPPTGFRPNRQLKPLLAQFFGGPPVDD